MRGRFFIILALIISAAAACNIELERLEVGADLSCSRRVPVESAEVYMGEDFYICGTVSYNGTGLEEGKVIAFGEPIMEMQETPVRGQGNFYLKGNADVQRHRIHHINITVEGPCRKSFPLVPIEIKSSCIQMPPSTIQAIPNGVRDGEVFAIQVSNADKDLDMRISGLAVPVEAKITKGSEWVQTYYSGMCCYLGERDECVCVLEFSFVDPHHQMCRNENTKINIRVYREKEESGEDLQELPIGALVLLAVVVVGTAIAVLMQ